MCEDVYTYLENMKSSTTANKQGFVSYFMQKDEPPTKKKKKPEGEGKEMKDNALLKKATKNTTAIYIKPVAKSLSEETLKKYADCTQKVYKMATKIHELNLTDIRHLDRFKADYNYAYLRHEIEKYLGELGDLDYDVLQTELMDMNTKYKNQAEIIRIALESLKRFLEHQNFTYYNENEESNN